MSQLDTIFITLGKLKISNLSQVGCFSVEIKLLKLQKEFLKHVTGWYKEILIIAKILYMVEIPSLVQSLIIVREKEMR